MSDQVPAGTTLRSEEKKLTVAFVQFLRQKVSQREINESGVESLEIAVQCLENAFQLCDKDYAFQPGKSLLQLLIDAEGLTGEDEPCAPTAEEIAEANKLKEEGNEFVKASKFEEAIEKYNQAIKLARDPVYFCNRAAAFCRLEQFDLAIQDCRTALALDEKYAKAYGRMGLAFSCQNNYAEAVESYSKALELEPNNESYKNNLAIAEEKKNQAEQFRANSNPFAGLSGVGNVFGGTGGPPDLSSFLSNPQMMQTAMQMMNDPNVQNLMNSMMGNFMNSGGASGQGGAPDTGGLANFFAAGQNIAQQMQTANPELVEQLRQQFAGTNTNLANQPQNPPSDGNNPPPQ